MIDYSQLMQDVMDGKESPFRALYIFKEQQKNLKVMIEVMEVEAFNQSEYEDKTFVKDGFKIEKRNGRKVWNFKQCTSYKIAKSNLTEIEDTLKASYSANEKGLNLVNEDAEIIDLPIVTFTKDSMIIKKI